MPGSKNRRQPAASRVQGRPAMPYVMAGLMLGLLLFGIAGFLWFSGRAGSEIGGPFTLENGAGQTVTARTFRGKYMLVYFGYTYCPDVCPTTLTDIAAALKQLGAKADRIAPLFITVDPARDTRAVVKRYAAAFSPRLIGLTGTPQQIAKVAGEYHVYYKKRITGPGPNDYSMDHSSLIYLMGPDGRFIAPIAASRSAKEMAADLSRLIS